MQSSFARLAALLLLAVAVVVGCRSMYDRADDAGGAAGTNNAVSSGSGSDAFSTANGFFDADSHDVPGGTPATIVQEVENAEEGEETASHFRAMQIDPPYETTAGPKHVMSFDIDNDGLLDVLSGWNQNQPVQIHLQRRDSDGSISFVSVTLGGANPIASIADVDMADFDGDGWLDAAVLVKETGSVGICPTPGETEPYKVLGGAGMGEVEIFFSPGNLEDITDGEKWQCVRMERSQLPIRRDKTHEEADTFPEFNGYTGLAVGEIDGINGPDVVVAYNPEVCQYYGDFPDPINRIVLYANPGGVNIRTSGGYPLSVTAVAQGPVLINTNGDEFSLDGTNSYYRIGISGLGPYTGSSVSYAWSQVAGTAVSMSGITSAEPLFTGPTSSTVLTFRLDVSAGGATDFDYVNVIVGTPANLPPTVVAGAEQTVVPDVDHPGLIVVQLSAAGTDPDGGALTYTWAQTAGTPVTLSGADTATPSFSAPSLGSEMRFRVTVSDGTLFDSDLTVVNSGLWAPIVVEGDLPTTSDVEVTDVDLDGDDDILYTYPDRLTSNIAWARNPMDVVGAQATLQSLPAHAWPCDVDDQCWEIRPIGHVDTFADVIVLGDVDMDGFEDVLTRSAEGYVVQWFRHPGAADLEPIFPPDNPPVPDRVEAAWEEAFNFPWQVYTMAQFEIGAPSGIVVGDLTGDGINEVAVAAGGVIAWYDASLVESTYEPWGENFVVDDTKANGTTDDPTDPDFQDTGTVIFSLSIVDLDGDGYGDVLATFDRRVDSGLADDTLLWFRNTLGDQTEIAPRKLPD